MFDKFLLPSQPKPVYFLAMGKLPPLQELRRTLISNTLSFPRSIHLRCKPTATPRVQSSRVRKSARQRGEYISLASRGRYTAYQYRSVPCVFLNHDQCGTPNHKALFCQMENRTQNQSFFLNSELGLREPPPTHGPRFYQCPLFRSTATFLSAISQNDRPIRSRE